ncbi:hypothetical protein BJ138DRAFT_1120383 [Hygrophoropsis aurantiaca]|uniref:Uncharacterized protein n=1 Tax=Hygrophoropsis aurantiaca TaxID=72124 RepID=A0ACB7ZQE3_9AGAM|nr:hypothetical protein BJ138DRAFT_1120383 [Hygrophoropsis aurantiaca]
MDIDEAPASANEHANEHQERRRTKIHHPYLYGAPCDHHGNILPPGSLPPLRHDADPQDWSPFSDQSQFLLADFLFCKVEMSAPNIDFLMELWAFLVAKDDGSSPFYSHRDAYNAIDSIRAGDVPWQCLLVDPPEDISPDAPTWKRNQYQIWYRDPDTVIKGMLDNPDFDKQFNYSPYVYTDSSGQQRWTNVMSGNYAWRQCDKIFEQDPTTEGATYVGVILGSDKTTVSVATGHVEYHPLYLSISNPHNSVRRAHRNAVTPIAFLAIPKSERKYLLHQMIKGSFKDHLVQWTGEYLQSEHGEARANEIMDDIDRRIAATPHFPGLRWFPHGRQFKQWTGDDSKALMKVYLPAIVEYVPAQLVKCLRAFLDFCYLVRRSELGIDTLAEAEKALQEFHDAREIFRESGIRPTGFSLPRRHSLVHYLRLIQEFGAPNGLSARVQFVAWGMLSPTHQKPARGVAAAQAAEVEDDDWADEPIEGDNVLGEVVLTRCPQRGYLKTLDSLAHHVNEPSLPILTRQFLFEQLNPDDEDDAMENTPLLQCMAVGPSVSVGPILLSILIAVLIDQSSIHEERPICVDRYYDIMHTNSTILIDN